MKKIYLPACRQAWILASFSLVLFIACGPSQKEEEKQKKTDDSIMVPERNAAIDKANKLLADTVAPAKDAEKHKK